MTKAIHIINKQLQKWHRLREQLESADLDAACLVDTLEGETDLFEALLMLAEEIAERDKMADAVNERIVDLRIRKARINAGSDTLRAIITQSMDRARIKRIPGNLCTLSLSDKQPGLLITDESSIPAKYFNPSDPVLDKALLKEDMDNDIDIRGVERGNGGIQLNIRRK